MMSEPIARCIAIERSGVSEAAAVDVAAKLGAVLADRARVRQREDLEAARVGEDRARPAHEAMQAADPLEQLRPRPQQQVIRVREDDRRAEPLELAERLRAHRAARADRHEDRRLDRAVQRRESARARARLRRLARSSNSTRSCSGPPIARQPQRSTIAAAGRVMQHGDAERAPDARPMALRRRPSARRAAIAGGVASAARSPGRHRGRARAAAPIGQAPSPAVRSQPDPGLGVRRDDAALSRGQRRDGAHVRLHARRAARDALHRSCDSRRARRSARAAARGARPAARAISACVDTAAKTAPSSTSTSARTRSSSTAGSR